MCGRYTLSESPENIAAEFRGHLDITGLESLAENFTWQPRYNIAPSQDSLVCIATAGTLVMKAMRWGLIPHWAKDQKIGNKLINARAETVAEKPSFRNAFKRRRCLVFSDGYYEWTKQGSRKQPVYVRPTDRKIIAFAGLWEQWQPDGQPPLQTFTIITTNSNADIAALHHRMPVTLMPGDCARWLAADATPDVLLPLLQPAPNGTFSHSFVSTFVNSPRHEGPQCIQAVTDH
ncbi:MAG: SOS response-associated peptidase [Gammaproteobacteria bacterium]